MSRTLLFKGKRKSDGEWIEGGYFQEDYTDKEYITCWNSTGLGYNEFFEVCSETVCQYTGLTDKNGNRIWENDFITVSAYSYVEPEDDYFGVVTYSDAYAAFGLIMDEKWMSIADMYGSYTTEIHKHGNIFDNPELLEE